MERDGEREVDSMQDKNGRVHAPTSIAEPRPTDANHCGAARRPPLVVRWRRRLPPL
jgi:hypothetical protein